MSELHLAGRPTHLSMLLGVTFGCGVLLGLYVRQRPRARIPAAATRSHPKAKCSQTQHNSEAQCQMVLIIRTDVKLVRPFQKPDVQDSWIFCASIPYIASRPVQDVGQLAVLASQGSLRCLLSASYLTS